MPVGIPDSCAPETWGQANASCNHTPGYVACPTDLNLYLELLLIEWLTIQHYGIQLNYLQYRDPVIKGLAGVKSPYLEMGGRWPIRVDPSDITRVYFHDPYARPPKPSWHVIPWIHALKGVEPFTDTTLREVKKLIAERGRDVADQKEIAETVIELQNRMDAPETWLARTRKARLRDSERARAAAQDRARTELGDTEPHDGGPGDPVTGEDALTAPAPPACGRSRQAAPRPLPQARGRGQARARRSSTSTSTPSPPTKYGVPSQPSGPRTVPQ